MTRRINMVMMRPKSSLRLQRAEIRGGFSDARPTCRAGRHLFRPQRSTQYLLQETIGQGVSHFWNGEAIGFGVAELTPEQYGLIAIEELRTRGHEMLSEFEIVDGTAVRKQFTRTVLGAKSLFLGGISDVETVIARGERLPKWSEVGWAAVDATMIAGGIGVAVKSLRVAKAPATIVGRGSTKFVALQRAGGGAVRSLSAFAKVSGVAAVVAIPYLAITRPQLVATAAGWVAEQIGMPAWLGVVPGLLDAIPDLPIRGSAYSRAYSVCSKELRPLATATRHLGSVRPQITAPNLHLGLVNCRLPADCIIPVQALIRGRRSRLGGSCW